MTSIITFGSQNGGPLIHGASGLDSLRGAPSARDATGIYYRDNDDLVNNDPVMRMVVSFLQHKLFGAGISFVRGEEHLTPNRDLDPNLYIPFLFRSLPFILAHGFLIYYIHIDEHDRAIPRVPEWPKITVKIEDVEGTPESAVRVVWKDEKIRTRLYVYNSENPFGVTTSNQSAPVDHVKPFLRQYYDNIEKHHLLKEFNIRPPIFYQTPHGRSTLDGARGDISYGDDDIRELVTRNMQTLYADDLTASRIQNASNRNRRLYTAGAPRLQRPAGWWEHVEARSRAPPDDRVMFVPNGLEYKSGQQIHPDPGFAKEQKDVLENIYTAFGIPYSVILASTANQSSNAIEAHNTTLINTLQTWERVYEIILTDIYRTIYDVGTGPTSLDAQRATKNAKPVPLPQKLVTVHLTSSFLNSPEQVKNMYEEHCVDFPTFQRLRAMAIKMPLSLIDAKQEPLPRASDLEMRKVQAQEDAVKLKERDRDAPPRAKK